MRLPAVIGAMGGALLAVIGVVALSPLLLPRVSVMTPEGGSPQAVVLMTPGFLAALSVVASGIFGAVIAFAARTVVPVFWPELEPRGGSWSALVLGAIIGGVVGVLAAFVGASVVGEETPTGLAIPFGSGLVLTMLGGAGFGVGTALGVFALSEPAVEGPEAEEIHAVRGRLLSAVGMPLAAFAVMGLVVLSLAFLLLRFHAVAPLLGTVVAAGVLTFAALIAARPRGRVPVTEVLLAAAAIGVVLLVIVAGSPVEETEAPAEGEAPTTTIATTTTLAG